MIQITFRTRGWEEVVLLCAFHDSYHVFIDFAQHVGRKFSIIKGLHLMFIFKSTRVIVFHALKKDETF
jgi:hypothetical protein